MPEPHIPGTAVPKTIWIYWAQGATKLPFLVEQCVSSWRSLNPDWQVRVIDDECVLDLVDLGGLEKREDIILQHLSDIIRIRLLLQHGGVWTDASLLCNLPLDQWLNQSIHDNFFCFSSARQDRQMTNWFLAGAKGSQLLQAWSNAIDDYWQNNTFRRKSYWSRQVIRKLISLRKRDIVSNDLWFSRLVLKSLRIFPYPINMYLFEKALDDNPSLHAVWTQTRSYVDTPAEHLQNKLGIHALLSPESRAYLTNKAIPVHKLNWRQDIGEVKDGTNFQFVLQNLHSERVR